MAKAKKTGSKYVIVRDTREQNPWSFEESDFCSGVVDSALPTGDYSLAGMEDFFLVERKGSVAELAKNVLEKRFEREMGRLAEIPHAFVVCEFTVGELMTFPAGAAIPWRLKKNVRMRGPFILKRACELMTGFCVPFIFAGEFGQQVTLSLMKRAAEARAR